MDVNLKINTKDALSALQRLEEDIDKAIFENFAYEGEKLVALTRDRSAEDSWKDQTGNLRSSIGYVVGKDKEDKLLSTYKTVKSGTEGSQKGKEYAKELASKQDGWSLHIVAGMEYAEVLEKVRGRNVLASARAKLAEDIPTLAKRIKDRVEKGKTQ